MRILCKLWVTSWFHTAAKLGRGTVALFVENSINCKPRPDLDDTGLNLFKSVFIEIMNSNKQIMVIGAIYRPVDHDINQFNVTLDLLLTKLCVN